MLLLSHRLGVPTLVHLHSHNLRQNSQCQQWQRGEVKKKRSAQVRCSNKTNGNPPSQKKKNRQSSSNLSTPKNRASPCLMRLVFWGTRGCPSAKRRWRKEPPNVKGGTQGRKREKRERETMWEDKTIGYFITSQFPPLQVCHIISLWPVTSGFRCRTKGDFFSVISVCTTEAIPRQLHVQPHVQRFRFHTRLVLKTRVLG